MKATYLVISMISAGITAAAYAAAPPRNVNITTYHYVGNTTETTLPNLGIDGMHAMCQSDFGPTARMCTTEEVFKTLNFPSIPPRTRSWVSPVITSVFSDGTDFYYMDIGGSLLGGGGVPFNNGINCATWNIAAVDSLGATISVSPFSGGFQISQDTCDIPRAVSCCIPQ